MIVLWYLFITTALLCMFLYLLSESGINLCFYPCWRCLDDTQLACCYLHNNYVCVWVCLSREYSRLKRTWAKGNWREIILSTVWAPVHYEGCGGLWAPRCSPESWDEHSLAAFLPVCLSHACHLCSSADALAVSLLNKPSSAFNPLIHEHTGTLYTCTWRIDLSSAW